MEPIENKYLVMFMDGPLQSWGYMSHFDRRTTLSYPTRSGIIGILCAAMGIDRQNTHELSKLSNLHLTIFVLRPGTRQFDFHTVGGGWDASENRQHIVPKANKSTGNTIITYREYLQDSNFAAIIEHNANSVEKLASALQNPFWGIWLGRKACIPTSPVYQGTFSDRDQAMAKIKSLGTIALQIHEVANFEDGSDTLSDDPLDFAVRKYGPRRIRIKPGLETG